MTRCYLDLVRRVLLGLVLLPSVAFAAFGWSGGRSCQPSSALAAVEWCAGLKEFVYASGNTRPYQFARCTDVASVTCTPAGAGGSCAAVAAMQIVGIADGSTSTSTSPAGKTMGFVVSACDLDYEGVTVSGGGGSSTTTGTVTAVFPSMTEGEVTDYMTLWYSFLALGVTVLCAKALYSRFRLSKYEG